jgi:hypothetical protein
VSHITLPRAAAVHMRDVLRGIINASDDDCGEPNCDDCAPVRVMKETVAALEAALAEPEKERAEVAAPARDDAESGYVCIRASEAYREHVTDGSPCWCNPELDYRDPDTGAEVWIHRREQ